MSEFTIYMHGTVSAAVTVQADSLEEAIEKALYDAPQTDFGFARFDGVDVWEVDGEYMKDGEYVAEATE